MFARHAAPRAAQLRSLLSTSSVRLTKCSAARGCSPAGAIQARPMSTSPSGAAGGGGGELGKLVYDAPFSRIVVYMKYFSLTTCSAGVAAAPALAIVSDPAIPLAVRVALPATIGAFGLFTTGMFHWCAPRPGRHCARGRARAPPGAPHPHLTTHPRCVKPYVHHLWYDAKSKEFTAEMRSFFVRPRLVSFRLEDMKEVAGFAPFASFEVQHGVQLFLHSEGFHDRSVLRALARRAPGILKDD